MTAPAILDDPLAELKRRRQSVDPLAELKRRRQQIIDSELARTEEVGDSLTEEKPPLLRRVGSAVREMVTHPVETAKAIVTAPVSAFKRSGEIMGQRMAEATLPPDIRAHAEADPERVSDTGALLTAAEIATLGLPLTRAGKLLVPASKAKRLAVQTGYGAGTGAVFSPDDPAVGAIIGGAAGAGFSQLSDALGARRALNEQRRLGADIASTLPGRPQRVPAAAVDESRLAAARGAPEAVARTQALLDQIGVTIDDAVVRPGAPRAPAAPESFPLGTTAAGSGPMFRAERTAFAQQPGVKRRPAGVKPVETPEPPATVAAPDPLEQLKARKVEAEPIPTIKAPVSAGTDLNAPSRIPEGVKVKQPRARGEEPSGVVETEGVVSVGPRITETITETPEPLSAMAKAEVAAAPDVVPAGEGPAYKGPKAFYSRLSDDALDVEYKAMVDKQAELVPLAEPPLMTPERLSQMVEQIENRRNPKTGKLSKADTAKLRQLQAIQSDRPQDLQWHTFESAAAAKQVENLAKHLRAAEAEMTRRNRDPLVALQRRVVSGDEPAAPTATATVEMTEGGYPASWDIDGPEPTVAASTPREYLNYAKFGLDRTTDARLRSTVERLRATGDVDKGYKSFATQQAEADAFVKQLVSDPLRIDKTKTAKLSGAEIVGMRQVAGENTRVIEGLSKAIESGKLSADEITQASAMIDAASQSTNDILGRIVSETAQTARDLGFLRQVAHLTTDPETWLVRAKKLLGDKPLPDVAMIEIRRLARAAKEVCGG